ncbi:MAG: efflux RND transporter periplasmic adaptor subunit [Rhizobiales bacterium]|nr:efflux RND transporter periplasmic adaptor subunit [Hyphomicrobiales bacterium]
MIAGLAAVSAAGLAGLWLVKPNTNAPISTTSVIGALAVSGDPIYFQDPNGRPVYSATPKRTAEGIDFRPVFASEERLSFQFADADDQSGAPATKPADRKIKFYRNPMGLADTSPVPKKDSMGMDYIPVYEGEQSDDGSVKVSPGKIQRTGVKSEPAAMRVVASTIRAPGTIQLDERRVSVVSMRSESWVQKVEDVTTGSRVHKGDPLMQVYSPAISSAAAEYVSVRGLAADAASGGNLGNGAKQRLLNLNVPESAIVAMEKSRNAPLAIVWTAPRDGVVLERNAVEGMRVGPGDTLFRLADTSVVWTLIDIAERDIARIAVGQTVSITARGFPGKRFHGTVSIIYPQVNKESRTIRLRIELANPDFTLLPDMYVDAAIDAGSQDAVLAVPESAVIDNGSKQTVFIDRGEGRLEPKEVLTGSRGEGYVEIRGGLTDGDRVVVSANFLIDAESNLSAAFKGFADSGAGQ